MVIRTRRGADDDHEDDGYDEYRDDEGDDDDVNMRMFDDSIGSGYLVLYICSYTC